MQKNQDNPIIASTPDPLPDTAYRLGTSRYGKARVRVAQITRASGGVHTFRELSVDVLTEGEFAASFLEGDNALVLPTDTMKNTVYVLAKRHSIESPEAFGALAARFFLDRNPAMSRVELTLRETRWERLVVAGQEHPHAFQAPGMGRPMARVSVTRTAEAPILEVESGMDDLCLLKTTGSEFRNYLRDDLTSLPETGDRILSTLMQGRWTYDTGRVTANADFSYPQSNKIALDAMLAVFAQEHSVSVQATLYSMGKAALQAVPELARVMLRLPNRHYLLFDLSRFGLENENEVFYPTDEPHGQIEASVERV
jgi:urate oxidase